MVAGGDLVENNSTRPEMVLLNLKPLFSPKSMEE